MRVQPTGFSSLRSPAIGTTRYTATILTVTAREERSA